MEIQAAIIGVAIFVVSGIILLSISLFGIKEKSYEEALAEQRQQTNALLGQQTKSKPKENKKQKKAGKKVYKYFYQFFLQSTLFVFLSFLNLSMFVFMQG